MTTARRGSVLDGTFFVLLALLAGLVLLAWLRGGSEAVQGGLGDGVLMLARFAPVIAISFLAAGFAEQLIPREFVRAWLGDDAGLRGIAIAACAGIVTPAGPFVSMPIAAVMIRAGAGAGAVVAFLAAWSLLALHRFLAWEVPILGWRFALLRYGACIALPVVAGLIARALARSS